MLGAAVALKRRAAEVVNKAKKPFLYIRELFRTGSTSPNSSEELACTLTSYSAYKLSGHVRELVCSAAAYRTELVDAAMSAILLSRLLQKPNERHTAVHYVLRNAALLLVHTWRRRPSSCDLKPQCSLQQSRALLSATK
jgi:hypothetical protein